MDRGRQYRQYLEQQQSRTSGVVGDAQRLKTEASTSAAELREFLSHLKGRSPQEVMGVVAESDLVRSTLTATAGCFVLLVVLTVVPYMLKNRSASIAEESAAAAVAQPADDAPAGVAETAAGNPDQAAAASLEPDVERAAEAMGIGGTAEADPDVNPLDSKLDKLLDGIE